MNFCMQKSYISLGIPIYLEEKNKAYSLLCLWLVVCLVPYYVPYTYINKNITFATAQGCNITKYFYTDRTVNGNFFFSRTSGRNNIKYILQLYEPVYWFRWSVSVANELLHWLSLHLPGKVKRVPIYTLISNEL